jgi:hypothetical protein
MDEEQLWNETSAECFLITRGHASSCSLPYNCDLCCPWLTRHSLLLTIFQTIFEAEHSYFLLILDCINLCLT